jgi:hypothetical protein
MPGAWSSPGLLLDQNAEGRFYGLFVLAAAVAVDWLVSLAGPRSHILDYHLMRVYRDVGYYPQKILDNHNFCGGVVGPGRAIQEWECDLIDQPAEGNP